jgi:hypothetical protein
MLGGHNKETPITDVVLVGHGGFGHDDPQGRHLVTPTFWSQASSLCILLC